MATAKTIDPMRDEIMEFVQKSEEAITEAGRKLGDRVSELVPGDGQSIRRAIDEAFDFTETILKSQREFANSMLDKVLGKPSSKRAPAAKRASAAKRTPAKSAARRTTRKATR